MSKGAVAGTVVDPFAMDREPLPIRRVAQAYLAEVKQELRGTLRTAGFAIPFILVPVAIYILFGVVIAGSTIEPGSSLPNYLFCSFSAIAAIMPGLFSCVPLATEREGNLLVLKRALPLPPGAMIVAKVVMAASVAAIAVTLVAVAALILGTVTLSPLQMLIIWAVMIVGTIPFSAIGLLLGSIVSASAAPAWGNLIFLPMMWLSGLFIPLPGSLEKWVVVWPAFHLNQLALGLAGVTGFIYVPVSLAAGVLIGVTVLCGGLAIRRLARVG